MFLFSTLFVVHSILGKNSQLWRSQLLKRSVAAVKWPLSFIVLNSVLPA